MTAFPSPAVEVLPATRHKRMRWANGGGWTTEIIAEPAGDQWDWRLSVADVEAAGPFSLFPDVDRSIALIRGNGFALTVAGDDEQVIDVPFQPFRFAGDRATTCRLLDGPVIDVNLMTRRRSPRRQLAFVHLAPSSTIELDNVEVVVVVDGTARFAGHDLGYLDAVRNTSPFQRLMLTSTAAGAIVTSVSVPTHG